MLRKGKVMMKKAVNRIIVLFRGGMGCIVFHHPEIILPAKSGISPGHLLIYLPGALNAKDIAGGGDKQGGSRHHHDQKVPQRGSVCKPVIKILLSVLRPA